MDAIHNVFLPKHTSLSKLHTQFARELVVVFLQKFKNMKTEARIQAGILCPSYFKIDAFPTTQM